MASSPSTTGPQPSPPRVKHSHRSAHKWYIELLEFCRAVAGLPAIVTIILELLRFNDTFVKIGTAVALLVAIGLRFFPKLRVSTVLPLLLSAILTVVLIIFVVPFRAKQDSNTLASSWLDWDQSLEKSVAACKVGTTLSADDAKCLTSALIPVVKSRPRPQEQNNLTNQASDLLAGQAIFANYKSRTLLDTRLSIGKEFVGSGYSEPINQTDLAAARVAEYLVPNLRVDRAPHVWFWEINPNEIEDKKRIVDRKLTDLLLKLPPSNRPAGSADFANNWPWMKRHLLLEDPTPILVRFALMDPKQESKCLGRAEASRVFMSNLGQVADLTLDEASQSSGHRGPEKDDDPALRLLVWVYAPERADQAVQATWGNVLTNFETWINDPPCQSAN